MNRKLDPRGRYDAVMKDEGLFEATLSGIQRTRRRFSVMSAFGCKADIRKCGGNVC
jgi:hypothetical protein